MMFFPGEIFSNHLSTCTNDNSYRLTMNTYYQKLPIDIEITQTLIREDTTEQRPYTVSKSLDNFTGICHSTEVQCKTVDCQ